MRILIASGGSAHSEVALQTAGALAAATSTQDTGAQLILLTVAVSEGRRAYAEEIAAQAAASLQHMIGNTGDAVETRVAVGRAADKIIQEAQAGDYDLLVIGERPGHRLIHRMLTNTVERLTERAPCPVLVAREQRRVNKWRRKRVRPAHVLICESGHRPLVTQRLIEKLSPMLALCRQATLLHVMSQIAAGPGVVGRDLRTDAADHIRRGTHEGMLLQKGLAALGETGVSARALLRHGRVVGEVIEEAQTGHYDLVVIGAFRAAGWDRLMLSDQAHAILTGTHQPLLVV